MVKCAVIADDLTGANATGVMLKKTVNVLHSQQTAAV